MNKTKTLHLFLANGSIVIGQIVATICSFVPISGFAVAFTSRCG
ncbi:MAG: hypothetical protein ACTS6A_01090 [Candidatus Hodgkinia cicadicola]